MHTGCDSFGKDAASACSIPQSLPTPVDHCGPEVAARSIEGVDALRGGQERVHDDVFDVAGLGQHRPRQSDHGLEFGFEERRDSRVHAPVS